MRRLHTGGSTIKRSARLKRASGAGFVRGLSQRGTSSRQLCPGRCIERLGKRESIREQQRCGRRCQAGRNAYGGNARDHYDA
jgi:hypothetical protein